MLSLQQISDLVYTDEMQKRSDGPLYIWVTGPFAAGKSFVIEHLSNELQKFGKVAIFLDTAHIIKEVNDDIEGLHHIRHDGGFTITDNVIHDRILDKLMKEAEAFGGDFFLIEMARVGRDTKGLRDLSYHRLSRHITSKILARSVFIRLNCPYEERARRNECRNGQTPDGKYRKASATLMERFSPEDDFRAWKAGINRPVVALDNS